MAVRDRELGVRPALRPLEPGLDGSGGVGDHPVAVLVELDLVERDHVRRPLARLRELELARLGLDVPRIVHAPLGPDVAEAHRLRPWQPAVLRPLPRAESEHVEPIGTGAERVLGALDDGVSGADLAYRLVLPQQPRATEDEEDLLRAIVRVWRRRKAPRLDADAIETDALRARGVPERLPCRGHRPLRAPNALDLVPVGDHARIMSTA